MLSVLKYPQALQALDIDPKPIPSLVPSLKFDPDPSKKADPGPFLGSDPSLLVTMHPQVHNNFLPSVIQKALASFQISVLLLKQYSLLPSFTQSHKQKSRLQSVSQHLLTYSFSNWHLTNRKACSHKHFLMETRQCKNNMYSNSFYGFL